MNLGMSAHEFQELCMEMAPEMIRAGIIIQRESIFERLENAYWTRFFYDEFRKIDTEVIVFESLNVSWYAVPPGDYNSELKKRFDVWSFMRMTHFMTVDLKNEMDGVMNGMSYELYSEDWYPDEGVWRKRK